MCVDDTSFQAVASDIGKVEDVLVPCVLQFAKMVAKLKLKLSPKAKIVASKFSQALRVAQGLFKYGVTFRAVKNARDLGITYGGAKNNNVRSVARFPPKRNKSGQTELDKRLLRVRSRTAKISKIAQVSRNARKLFSGSAFASGTWGHQASGLSVSQTLALERQAVAAAGFPAKGRCRTTSLVIAYGVQGTVKSRLIRETVVAWFSMLKHFKAGESNLLRHAWVEAKRSSKVGDAPVGLMTNMLHIVRNAGWHPHAFNAWEDTQGWAYALADATISPTVIANKLAIATLNKDLARASSHYDGKGMHKGIDWHVTLATLRACKGAESYPFKCALETVLAGACWPGHRIVSINPLFSQACPRCGHHCENSEHTFWECPANENIDHPAVTSTQRLAPAALLQSEE